MFLRWEFHVWEVSEQELKKIIRHTSFQCQCETTRLNSSNTHFLLRLLVTGLEFFEKYGRWNSHALGILSAHFLALDNCGQLSSLCSCGATKGLTVSREVKPAQVSSQGLSLFVQTIVEDRKLREALHSPGTRFQSRKCYFFEPLSKTHLAHGTERVFGSCFLYN